MAEYTYDMSSPRAVPTEDSKARSDDERPCQHIARISDVVEDTSYMAAYMSDEEAASPADDDLASLHSTLTLDSDVVTISPERPEPVRIDSTDRCRQAQAVTLYSVGKVRMVSVPRLVECSSPTSPRRKPVSRVRLASPSRPNVAPENDQYSSHSSESSRAGSSHSSNDDCSISTTPSSPHEEQAPMPQYKPERAPRSVPLLEAAMRANAGAPPNPRTRIASVVWSSDWPQAETNLMHDRPAYKRAISPTDLADSPMHPKRKSSKFQPVLSLARLSKSLSRRDSALLLTPANRFSAKKEVTFADNEPRFPPMIPTRSQSVCVKMVARGADERAPPIILPPCPLGEAQDDMQVPRTRRRDSEATHSRHSQRRSLSMYLIPSQG